MAVERVELAKKVHPTNRAWLNWIRAHGLPEKQIPLDAWIERDTEAKTVSARIYWHKPTDDVWDLNGPTYTYADVETDEPRTTVMTVHLDREPAPFPPLTAF